MFFIFWHKGLLRRVTARQKNMHMNTLWRIVFVYLGVSTNSLLYFTIIIHYKSEWNLVVMFWLKKLFSKCILCSNSATLPLIEYYWSYLNDPSPAKTMRNECNYNCSQLQSYCFTWYTAQKQRGNVYYAVQILCRLAWTYKDALILKWAMKYTGL